MLLGNPIAKEEDYRQRVEELLPALLLLDREPTSKNVRGKHKKMAKISREISTLTAVRRSSLALTSSAF